MGIETKINNFPKKAWTDEEAMNIISRFQTVFETCPELQDGCLYFFSMSIPTDQHNEDGTGVSRSAHFMSGHPQTAVLVGTGMASVRPSLLSELAAFLSRITTAPAIQRLTQRIEEKASEDSVTFTVPTDTKLQ